MPEASSATQTVARPSAGPYRDAPPRFEIDFDAEKHPCEAPIAPEDAPSMADVLASGQKLSSKQFITALLECQKLHGPSNDYESREANADGSIHPLLSAAMSIRQVWPAMRHCYADPEPAEIRLSFSFWLHEDGAMTVDDIKTVHSKGLDADQIACVEGSMSVAEAGLRRGDATKMGLPERTVLEMPRVLQIQLKDSTTDVTGSGFRPPTHLDFFNEAKVEEQVRRCGSEPMGATLHWDPGTGELLEVEPDASVEPESGRCLAKLLSTQLAPRKTQFFPRTDADTYQRCTFHGDQHSCESGPLFRLVTP
ncbi:MAG: hypothetical protein ACRBN8_23355 [Nannocystales bacterium]